MMVWRKLSRERLEQRKEPAEQKDPLRIQSPSFMLAILLNSTCWSSILLRTRENSLDISLSRSLCFIFNIACETSPIEGRFLWNFCRHLRAMAARSLTSSMLHSPTSFLSSISSTPSGLIPALKVGENRNHKSRTFWVQTIVS